MNKYAIAGKLAEADATEVFIKEFLDRVAADGHSEAADDALADILFRLAKYEEDNVANLQRGLNDATANLGAARVVLAALNESDADIPKSISEKEPEERCAFPGCGCGQGASVHDACVPRREHLCIICIDGSRNSRYCHDFVPLKHPEPEKPVARYASGEEPMVGDVVESVADSMTMMVSRFRWNDETLVAFTAEPVACREINPRDFRLICRVDQNTPNVRYYKPGAEATK